MIYRLYFAVSSKGDKLNFASSDFKLEGMTVSFVPLNDAILTFSLKLSIASLYGITF
jgi:hypothetical protein